MSSGTPLTASNDFALLTPKRSSRLAFRAAVGAAAAATLLSVAGLPALAAPVIATVNVTETLALRDLTGAFSITGAPAQTVAADVPVEMNVLTNDQDGYTVTVEGATDTFTSTTSTDTFPVSTLEVNSGDLNGWFPVPGVSGTALAFAGTTGDPSGPAGDDITANFRMTIPNVEAAVYTTTLNVIATPLVGG